MTDDDRIELVAKAMYDDNNWGREDFIPPWDKLTGIPRLWYVKTARAAIVAFRQFDAMTQQPNPLEDRDHG